MTGERENFIPRDTFELNESSRREFALNLFNSFAFFQIAREAKSHLAAMLRLSLDEHD